MDLALGTMNSFSKNLLKQIQQKWETNKFEDIYISIYIDPKDEFNTTEIKKSDFIKNARNHLLSKNIYFFDADIIDNLKNN